MPRPPPLQADELMAQDGTILQPLAVWCARNNITPANARGQYRDGIPMRNILGRNYVPKAFVLPPPYSRQVKKK